MECAYSPSKRGSQREAYNFVLSLLSWLYALQRGLFPASASLRKNDEHCLSDYDLAAKISCKCTHLLK